EPLNVAVCGDALVVDARHAVAAVRVGGAAVARLVDDLFFDHLFFDDHRLFDDHVFAEGVAARLPPTLVPARPAVTPRLAYLVVVALVPTLRLHTGRRRRVVVIDDDTTGGGENPEHHQGGTS